MNPITFTAIDFETAQGYHHSICQVGMVRVREGEVVDTLSLLVQPPNNDYWWRNTQVHGLTAQDTANAPTFDRVWPQIRSWIEEQTLVAHNMAFDGSCLRRTLNFYGLPQVSYHSQCTLRIYGRKGLSYLCEQHGIPLQHHDALSDARACAELYLRHLRR
jgi:DNA polymerase-3 subunit epsilon